MPYNTPYRRGKFGKTEKATRADYAKTAWKNLTEDEALWRKDPRKYDMPYRDTGADFAERDSKGGGKRFIKRKFKYKFRSKLKVARSGRRYRRYFK